jgi:hypothetical protein
MGASKLARANERKEEELAAKLAERRGRHKTPKVHPMAGAGGGALRGMATPKRKKKRSHRHAHAKESSVRRRTGKLVAIARVIFAASGWMR